MARILALDTSTEACSAALQYGDSTIERFEALPRGHAQRILSMLQDLLDEAGITLRDLDAITFCRGPGAFTGVRIGCGVVQGIAFGADLPVVPVSTLQVLAQGAFRTCGAERAAVAIDARMGEVYFGEYSLTRGLMVACTEEVVAPPDRLAAVSAGSWMGVGTGWAAYETQLRDALGEPVAVVDALPRALDCLPSAVEAVAAGRSVAAGDALPVYLRDKVTG